MEASLALLACVLGQEDKKATNEEHPNQKDSVDSATSEDSGLAKAVVSRTLTSVDHFYSISLLLLIKLAF